MTQVWIEAGVLIADVRLDLLGSNVSESPTSSAG